MITINDTTGHVFAKIFQNCMRDWPSGNPDKTANHVAEKIAEAIRARGENKERS